MAGQFETPSWATEPTEEYSLEVLKEGCIVGVIPLSDKPVHIIGRNGDVCDVVFEHQTVSRVHAVTLVRRLQDWRTVN